MAGISFGAKAESDWMVAGWAFRQVLDDLETYVSGDQGVVVELNAARHLGFLSVPDLSAPLQVAVRGALRSMCADIIDGRYSSGIGNVHPDWESRKLYADGIWMLRTAIDSGDAELEYGSQGWAKTE